MKHTEAYKELKPDVYVETQTYAHGNRKLQVSRLVTGEVQYLIHFASSQKTAWNKCWRGDNLLILKKIQTAPAKTQCN